MKGIIAAAFILIASPAFAENVSPPCFAVVPLSAGTVEWPPAILINKCTGDTWALSEHHGWTVIEGGAPAKPHAKIQWYDSNGNPIK